jgi:hypothetical protein
MHVADISLHVSWSPVRFLCISRIANILYILPSSTDQPDNLFFETDNPPEKLVRLVALKLFAFFQLAIESLKEFLFSGIVPWEVAFDLLFQRAVGNVLVSPLGVERVLKFSSGAVRVTTA